MPTVLLLCSVLLVSMISVTNAVLCFSTDAEDCPGSTDNPFCIVNCSQVAIERFNQPASHGNCGLFFEVGGTARRHACYVNECPFTECIPITMEGASTIDCCCTEDLCNQEFATPPTPSPTPSPPVVDLLHLYFDDFPHHTNNTGMYVYVSVVLVVCRGYVCV